MRTRIAAVVLSLATAAAAQPAGKIGLLQLEGAPRERPAELAWLTGTAQPTLRDIGATIRDAADDPAVSSLVIRLKDATLSRTHVEEIGAAVKAVRDSGKKVRLYCESYGPTETLLASYVDEAIVQEGGEVSLPGMHMEEMYLADTLSWLGVKADMVQVGDYKGANEMFVNSAPSKAWDENINQLLDSLYGAMRAQIKAGRKLDDAGLDEAMKAAWMADAPQAIKVGLIDAAVDLPALGRHITGNDDAGWAELTPGDEGKPPLDPSNPFAAMSALAKLISEKPDHTPKGPTIAVLHIQGVIVDGDSTDGGLFGGGQSVGSRTIRNALEEILKQDKIRGVIVRVDSPGGSAVASEVIWQGIRRVAEKKPVWASVGSMAASGGMYVSVAADKIYLNPSSIVGSIGVVGGKVSMGGLYEKLKVGVVGRSRGPMAEMFDSTKAWDPQQLAAVRAQMTRTFDLFKGRVAAGRKGIDLSRTAGGWLFAGQKAIDMKLADKIGGLEAAIDDMAASLSLTDCDVLDYPAPKSLAEIFEDAAKGFGVSSPRVHGPTGELAAALRAVVGERAWPEVSRALQALMLLRDRPVALIAPRTIIIR